MTIKQFIKKTIKIKFNAEKKNCWELAVSDSMGNQNLAKELSQNYGKLFSYLIDCSITKIIDANNFNPFLNSVNVIILVNDDTKKTSKIAYKFCIIPKSCRLKKTEIDSNPKDFLTRHRLFYSNSDYTKILVANYLAYYIPLILNKTIVKTC